MNNILITGGSGMVGRNLKLRLKSINQPVFAPTKNQLNLLNFNKTVKFIEKNKINFIIHCASIVGGILDNQNNLKQYLVYNTEINKNVLLAAETMGVKNFINIGSSCMYPKDRKTSLKETMIFDGRLEPTNEGHAISKIFSAKLCSYIDDDSAKYHYKTLVPCNLYGSYDNFDLKRSHFIPAIVRKVYEAKKDNKKFVEIWGDGKARRECMHVNDLVEAIIFCMKNMVKIPSILNVGTGKDHTIFQIYKIAAKLMNLDCEWVFKKDMPIGMKRKILDVKIINDLGWENKISLEEGLNLTFDFYKKNYI